MGVPGVTYQVDQGDVIKQVTSSGVATASTLQLLPDHTYVWNSQWDGKTYRGTWTDGNSDYPVVIAGAQEGKTWKVGAAKDGAIYVWDGNAMSYTGRWVRS